MLLLSGGLFILTIQLILCDIPTEIPLSKLDPKETSFKLGDTQKAQHPIVSVALNQINPAIIKAVLVAEDDLFFTHSGFNLRELKIALELGLKKGRFSRGASTITQQLARNLFLSPQKSFWRKSREALITLLLENQLSKEKILQLYLNTAQFGPEIYGIEQASQFHFKKPAQRLSSNESALLAAFLPNPGSWGKRPYPSIAYRRQKKILGRMNHYALNLPKRWNQSRSNPTKNKANNSTQKKWQTLNHSSQIAPVEITLTKTTQENIRFDQFDKDSVNPEDVFLDE